MHYTACQPSGSCDCSPESRSLVRPTASEQKELQRGTLRKCASVSRERVKGNRNLIRYVQGRLDWVHDY